MKKWLKRLAWFALCIFIGLQLAPVDRANPTVDLKKTLHAPPQVEAILRQSCYDCHSDETRWPWYTHVAPVSWWIVGHIHEARENLNFSRWADLSYDKQGDMLGDIATEITTGDMPIPSYLQLHSDARLSPAQAKIITDWTDTEMKAVDAAAAAPRPTKTK